MDETQKQKKPAINYKLLMQTRKNLLIAIAFAGVAVGIFFVVIFPRIQSIQESLSEKESEERKRDQLMKKLEVLERVDQTSLYTQKDQMNAILPSVKPLLSLLQEINRVSGETGVIVSEFDVVPGQISTQSAEAKPSSRAPGNLGKDMDLIETKLTLVGKVESVNEFLKKVNEITPLTETTALTLKAINRKGLLGGQGDENVFEAGVTLVSYFYVGKPSTTASQDIPNPDQFEDSVVQLIQQFKIPTSQQTPPEINIQGGGKQDLFQ